MADYGKGTARVARKKASTKSRASVPPARSSGGGSKSTSSKINFPAWMKKSYKASK